MRATLQIQAKVNALVQFRFGEELVAIEDTEEVEAEDTLKRVVTSKGGYLCRKAIVACGLLHFPRRLPVLDAINSKNVHYKIPKIGDYEGHRVAVVGGGDSALEEATFLTRFADKVTLVHRRDALRASKIMQDKARANPKIAWMLDSEVEDIHDEGSGEVKSMAVRHNKSGERTNVPLSGVFVAIGHTPNTGLFRGQIEMDANGYIMTHDGAKTSVPGVFACGDVQDHIYRQAITAAGSGCMAALDAEHYLDDVPEHLQS